MHRTGTAYIHSLDKFGTVLDFCGNATESGETCAEQTKSIERAACRDTHKLPTSGPLEDGASRRERNFGGGEKSIFAGEKCIEFGKFGGHLHEPKRDSVVV